MNSSGSFPVGQERRKARASAKVRQLPRPSWPGGPAQEQRLAAGLRRKGRRRSASLVLARAGLPSASSASVASAAASVELSEDQLLRRRADAAGGW